MYIFLKMRFMKSVLLINSVVVGRLCPFNGLRLRTAIFMISTGDWCGQGAKELYFIAIL